MTKALFVPLEGGVRVVDLPADSYLTLRDLVGGWLTSVDLRGSVPNTETVTMYADDEFLLHEPPQRANVVASWLAGQFIGGNVVLVGNTSPSGEYDGENYDVPSWMLDEHLHTEWTLANLNETMLLALEAFRPTPSFTVTPMPDNWLN